MRRGRCRNSIISPVKRITFPRKLLDHAKEGEPEAFRDIIARARACALRIAIACFGLRLEDAEDAAQEAVLGFHLNLQTMDSPESFLYAAVRNQARHLAAERRNEPLGAAEPVSPAADIGVTDIWDCVLRLTDRCRNLILNLFYRGYTERELAALQDVNKVTIHKRKRTCFGALYALYLGGPYGKRMLCPGRDSRPWRGRAASEDMPDLS